MTDEEKRLREEELKKQREDVADFLEDVIIPDDEEDAEDEDLDDEENDDADDDDSDDEEDSDGDDSDGSDDDDESGDDGKDGEEDDDSSDDGEDEGDSSDDEDESGDDDDDESEPGSLEALKAQNAQLLQLIEQGVISSLGITPPKKADENNDSGKKDDGADTKPTTLAEMIGEVNFDDFSDDPDKFVALLQKVVDHTRQSTIDGLQADLPKIVTERATQAINLQALVDNFYRDNADLAAVKKTVSVVAQNVGQENPTWDMTKVLAEAAKKTRKLLGVPEAGPKKTGNKKPTRTGKKPSIPKAKGKRAATNKKVSKLQKQINDIIDL